MRLARKSRVELGCKCLKQVNLADMRHRRQAQKTTLCFFSRTVLVSICSAGTTLGTVTQLPALNVDDKKEMPLGVYANK